MNLNPVFEKEIKRHTRSIRISWIVFAANLLMGSVAVMAFFGESTAAGVMRSADYSMPARCYMLMAYALFGMILVAVPAIAGGSISLEREGRTLDVLLTTNLNPWKIITGKLEGALSVVFLLAFSTMPAIALVLAFGGINVWDLFFLVLIVLLGGIYIGSIGIFCSVIFRRTTVATVMSYVIVLLLAAGTVLGACMAYYVSRLGQIAQETLTVPTAGAGVYLLLLNPLVTYVGLLSRQVGNGHEVAMICSQFGNYNSDWIVRNMIPLSITVQLGVSFLLLVIAGRRINPLHR